jgi:hypothetical protein
MMKRLALSVICALGLQATVALGAPPKPSIYQIEAYLDRAPKGVEVVDTVRIGRAGRSRLLLITNVRAGNSDNPGRIFRDVDTDVVALHVNGRTDRMSQLMELEAGKKLSGTIVYRTGNRTVIFENLES